MHSESRARWPYFPVFLKLEGERVLLVGGGVVAARKLELLRRAGARVDLVARELSADVKAAVDFGAARFMARNFEPAQLQGCRLAIAATDDTTLNRAVAAAATQLNIPVNVVDDAALSSYVMPAVVDRAPLLVAVGRGGASPVLARRVREKIEALLPAALGGVAAFMQRQRSAIKQRVVAAQRRGLWERFLDSPAVGRLLTHDEAAAEKILDEIAAGRAPRGEVYLVGAGPGDPDLLTLRALRLMQQCDVVLYDRLISPGILDLVRRDAERMFVGKEARRHVVPQDQINAELVRLAQAGKRVLRLKGGDPFIFGRGGEEIDTLAAAGIAFEVVPGITAASGCAAYAGIPLTHRDYAQSCVFVTGHARAGGELELHWDQLARRGQTVVIYMGLQTLPQLCARLIEHGLPADWPAALVEEGTSAAQRVVTATLGDLPSRAIAEQVTGASLVIVGEVVKLHEKLAWFGSRKN